MERIEIREILTLASRLGRPPSEDDDVGAKAEGGDVVMASWQVDAATPERPCLGRKGLRRCRYLDFEMSYRRRRGQSLHAATKLQTLARDWEEYRGNERARDREEDGGSEVVNGQVFFFERKSTGKSKTIWGQRDIQLFGCSAACS